MSIEDLRDISKRPDFKEITSRGGSVKGITKTFGQYKVHSKYAKCKNCKVDCIYKEENEKINSEHICVCPSLRANALINSIPIVGLTFNKIDGHIDELMKYFKDYSISKKEKLKIVKSELINNKDTDLKVIKELKKNVKQAEHELYFAQNMIYSKELDLKKIITPQKLDVRQVGINFNLGEKEIEEVLKNTWMKIEGGILVKKDLEEKKEEKQVDAK